MQYRYHEWRDPILSKTTAESISASSSVGLKMGYDQCEIVQNGNNLSISIFSSVKPSNTIYDRLHVEPNGSNIATTISSVITPDCVITTEDTPINNTVLRVQGRSYYMLVASHDYLEVARVDDTTSQGGTPTNYNFINVTTQVVNLTSNSGTFISDYLYQGRDNWHPLTFLDNLASPSMGRHNSTVIGILEIVETSVTTAFQGNFTWVPIYNNLVPVQRIPSRYEFEQNKTNVETLLEQVSSLRTDLESYLQNSYNYTDEEIAKVRNELTRAVNSLNQYIYNLEEWTKDMYPSVVKKGWNTVSVNNTGFSTIIYPESGPEYSGYALTPEVKLIRIRTVDGVTHYTDVTRITNSTGALYSTIQQVELVTNSSNTSLNVTFNTTYLQSVLQRQDQLIITYVVYDFRVVGA